eukprot:901058-Amphidinium_carterae.1
MRIVVIKWKRYLRLKADLYNPHTQNNCLFMCAAFILLQRGIVMSQQEVRNRTAKLWLAGAACFGGSLQHWAAIRQLSPESFIAQLRTTGWGSAADACILAHSLQASCYIYDYKGDLLVSSPCSRSLFSMNLRLAGEHYTVVDEANINMAHRHLSACYKYCSHTGQSWQYLTHLASLLRVRASGGHHRAFKNATPSPLRSTFTCSGGAMRAQTQVTPLRQFQLVGRGEDGSTLHTVQNAHDLAIYIAHAPDPEEAQPDQEGFSRTLPLEGDDRPFILTRLRQLTVQLLSFATYRTKPEDIEDLGASQTRGSTPKPSCSCSYFNIGSDAGSEGEEFDDCEYLPRSSSAWECPMPSEYEFDYDPSSMGRSLSAQWNGSQLTDSVLSPFHYAFDIDEDEAHIEQYQTPGAYRFAHFMGRVPGCAYCRAHARMGEEPCQRCNGRLLPPILHCGGTVGTIPFVDIELRAPCLGFLRSPILLCGGALRIITHSPSGRAIHDIAECGKLTVHGFVELHNWTNVAVLWQHHVLHPDVRFADYKLDFLVLLMMPNCPSTDDMTEIRPLDQCKASATWSLAEFSFWHSLSIQNYIKAVHQAPCQSEYYGHDTTEYAHRGWLADIVERRNQAIDMLSSWRNVKRRISRKRKFPTCSSTLIYETVTNPPSLTPSQMAMAGGASDSAIRQKLAKKARKAGVLHANDFLQLVWDPGKFFPADPVFENDPWGKFTGSKPGDPLANSSSSSSGSKPSSKAIVEPLLQIAKFEQQPNLASMLENAQVSAGPIAILTHRAATVAGHNPTAQVQVVVQVGESKKVLHLAVYLRGVDY